MIYVMDNEVKIQGYQKVLKISEDEVVFLLFKQTIFINGEDLMISYFEKDEFTIKGKIKSIKFEK